MSIQTTKDTAYSPLSPDTLNRIVHELRSINNTLQGSHGSIPTTGVGGGDASAANQLTEIGLLTQIETNTASAGTVYSTNSGAVDALTLRTVLNDAQEFIQDLKVWDKIVGNSKEFTWVVGNVQPFVVDTIVYKTGVTTILTQTFTYDANDNVASITAS